MAGRERRRTALVTGANRGLGLAVGSLLHARGFRVVLGGRDEEAVTTAASELGAEAVVLDVSDDASVKRAAERVGRVDVLVNNAGTFLDRGDPPSAVPLPLVEATLAVNVLGAWRVSQAFVPGMVEQGWGRVVMVSSGTGSFTNGLFPQAPAYSASKAALNAVTVLLAKETDGTGVLVNAVNPGLVRTRMRPDAKRSPEDAAADIAYAATLPDGAPSGVFFRSGAVVGW
ncbi:SDR family NAD(P)-dependent oxidoreductase [Streptomyces sp. V1I1]|uniref:SDR family NAD(P)-dependent oxidoreductase n=1 Tax=Streptomyces sp. V1I1 TaxID=3042272 RepID=UPI00277F3966|nr:SDR family NAD(P)-dependent oxidoreductase [Streptomyces sp. V1I1]MDQ0939535.1 NAD(P)-dependent dehydrogenase (short-subunit alcohol dehydrogenase family) [Streptomyces sp. V1I1]